MDTTEKNRVVKSKDAFDKKEVIIMSKKKFKNVIGHNNGSSNYK